MRLAICLLGLMLPVWAQLSFIDFAYPLPELRAYLGLSSAQVAAMVRASDAYWLRTRGMDARRVAVDAELQAETARSPLRPSELGRLYAERERIRREFAAAGMDQNRAVQAELTEAQRAIFRPLGEVLNNRKLGEQARSIGLAPIDCGNPQYALTAECDATYIPNYSRIPEWAERATDDPKLRKFLGLNDSQVVRLNELRDQSNQGGEFSRMFTVLREVREELGREPLDQEAVGVRAAELEALRRGLRERREAVRREQLAVLTEAQRVKFAALEEAVRLGPAVREARSMGVMGARCEQVVALELSNPREISALVSYLGDCPDARALEELP